MGHGSISDIFIDKAIGANLIDVDENIFIDFAGGIGTMNIGHSHPKVVRAIKDQSSGIKSLPSLSESDRSRE